MMLTQGRWHRRLAATETPGGVEVPQPAPDTVPMPPPPPRETPPEIIEPPMPTPPSPVREPPMAPNPMRAGSRWRLPPAGGAARVQAVGRP